MPLRSPADQVEPRRGQRLLFLAGLFGILLNFPLLAVFDHEGRVAGVPVLYLYVLLMWVLLVVLTARLVRERGRSTSASPPGPLSEKEKGS